MQDVGIEIPVLDLEKGIEFYETVFGWSFDRERMPNQGWATINGSIGVSIFQTEKLRPKGLNIGFKVKTPMRIEWAPSPPSPPVLSRRNRAPASVAALFAAAVATS